LPERLAWYLNGYNKTLKDNLIKGFSTGFPLGCIGSIPTRIAPNHASVTEHIDFVRTKITAEIAKKRIKGPFSLPPLDKVICSPLGVVPKKSPNSFRLIHDLSFSKGHGSFNSLIPSENCTVTLETFDHVAALVLEAGRNYLIAKADIEEAFRIIPISPVDYSKLGFTFQGKFLF
jgi:hypothetical protein